MTTTLRKSPEFLKILLPYQKKVEVLLQDYVHKLGPQSPLRDACEYAFTNGGKRFRPALVLMMGDALGKHDVNLAALAVEFFHTSSLIADDLPCMDNDDKRRDKPSTHKVYGEATALLASYALIAAGFECLAANARLLGDDNAGLVAIENATQNTGILGACGGQWLDLYPPNLSLEVLEETLRKKTVALFEVSMVLGWIYGGGELARLNEVKRASYHFGMAFQIADDLDDLISDDLHGRKVNYASVLGVEKAKSLFQEELTAFRNSLKVLGIETSSFEALAQLLEYSTHS